MNFSQSNRTVRNNKMYDQNIHPKLSVNEEKATNASKKYDAEEINISKDQISPELIEEKIRANLEPLNEQILTLSQLLNQLIQDNSAKATPMAGSQTHRWQTGLSLARETRVSRFHLFEFSCNRLKLPLKTPKATSIWLTKIINWRNSPEKYNRKIIG